MGFIRVLLRQENIEISTLAVSIGSFMYFFGKNTYFMKKWVERTGKKDDEGEPIPVDTVLKFRFESVLQKFEFTDWNKKYISLYINKELDPNSLGSCNLKQGISVGAPEYYQRLSDESIKKSVEIGNNTIDWESPAGKRLLESLKLDEFAQKYIIACNVALVEGNYSSFDSLVLPLSLVGAYSAGNRLYSYLKLRTRPLAFTLAVYAIQISFFTCLYLFAKDALFTIYFKAAEEKVSSFGFKFMEGGIEYYKKKIERNKALRELLPNGSKHFTEDGNEVGIWRVKGIPDTFKLIAAKERVSQFTFLEDTMKIPTPNPNPHPII